MLESVEPSQGRGRYLAGAICDGRGVRVSEGCKLGWLALEVRAIAKRNVSSV